MDIGVSPPAIALAIALALAIAIANTIAIIHQAIIHPGHRPRLVANIYLP